ncbi:protein kinase [Lentisphaera profundi]|uniref:Protein kinase n=1 Tax=Lentisphaera profundi TaxID=1658616 RepID=A0ABY7VV91_9BACT|nr:protein kinase [Lentisphaera profundi]WDE97208.1 protein kinase [Lentisphaera profundi]
MTEHVQVLSGTEIDQRLNIDLLSVAKQNSQNHRTLSSQVALADPIQSNVQKYQSLITCSNCEASTSFQITELFEKVQCPHCHLKFRVPIETNLFIYDKHIYESDFINIFRAQNKKADINCDVVVYEKTHAAPPLEELKDIFTFYASIEIKDFLSPLHCTEDDSAYYISRENSPYRMNHYLAEFGKLPKDQVAFILHKVCKTAHFLAKKRCFGAFLPSDVMLELDGTVKLADYSIRELILSSIGLHSTIANSSLAPELISSKDHDEASSVYSLAILAITFLTGKPPFTQKDPLAIEIERAQFIETFDNKKLPSFLKIMLDPDPLNRPNFSKSGEFFKRLHRKNKSA